MGGKTPWSLREEETYERCVGQLGGARRVDRAIATIINGLTLNPEGFYRTSVAGIWIAKTRLIVFGEREIIPALILRFRIIPPATVSLLHIETAMPEDMETSDEILW